MRRFRVLHNVFSGPLEFGDVLEFWDYPRRPSLMEFQRSAIYGYGDDCIFWLERVASEWETAILHLAVAPSTQKQHGIAPRKLFRGLDVICDLEGIDRVIANDCTESGEVTDYLRRLGWKPCDRNTIGGEWFERCFADGEARKEDHGRTRQPEHQHPETRRGPRSQEGGHGTGAETSRSATRTGRECLRTP